MTTQYSEMKEKMDDELMELMYGAKDQACPICLEEMPQELANTVWKMNGNERTRAWCCGNFLCHSCCRDLEDYIGATSERIESEYQAQNPDFQQLGILEKELERLSNCAMCRSELPVSDEDVARMTSE